MTKKLLITLSILTLFANATKASDNNSATHDEGVVINGVRWATRNVDMPGTFAETPESFGMLFQWNRKKAWSMTDEEMEGWDSTNAEGTEWYAENDPCPEGWRVPTHIELNALRIAGVGEWTTRNGVNGRYLGIVPDQIFLPTTGFLSARGGRGIINQSGAYWSSTPSGTTNALRILFDNTTINAVISSRANAFAIRCVAK